MNSSSNLLVLGVTGQVGQLVARHLRRSEAHFTVGSRRKANLAELADHFGASRFIDLDDPRTFNEALEDVTEAAAVILMEGPEKHSGRDYWFSADVLDPQQVAETLTGAIGHKFKAAVRDHERFLKELALPAGSTFEPAYAKGGIELFREVEHGRMAYIGSVADDTKNVLGREPLLLRDWAKLHANELLEIARR